jgi:hypothetical protein
VQQGDAEVVIEGRIAWVLVSLFRLDGSGSGWWVSTVRI